MSTKLHEDVNVLIYLIGAYYINIQYEIHTKQFIEIEINRYGAR